LKVKIISRTSDALETICTFGKNCYAEDARFVLPNACTTSIGVSFNLRSLMHFMELRLCSHAQWEIRELAGLMRK
jgi:flavin-dependent thymidylate synthase